MKILRDFECTVCDTVAERLVESDVTTAVCECGHRMEKKISAPRIKLEGWSGHFPTAASKWERQHEEAAKENPDKPNLTHY